MNRLRLFLSAALLGAASLPLAAQTTTTTTTRPPTTVTAPTPPRPDPALGAAIKSIVDANRATISGLRDQRKTLLEQLRNATPEQRDAIRGQLHQVMRDTQAAQRNLAKSIRDAIKARRDASRPAPPPGG